MQITRTEICTVKACLVFKLLSRKLLFISRKDKRNCKKVLRLLFKKIANFTGKLLQNYK